MSYANGTTHYNLPQTVGTDKRDWFDTNEAFASVDAALYGVVEQNATDHTDIAAIKATIVNLQAADVQFQSDLSETNGRVTTLEQNATTDEEAIDDLADMFCPLEVTTAQSDIAVATGRLFRYNGVIYVATTDIAIGDTIVPNTNCTATNMEEELSKIDTALSTVTAVLGTLTSEKGTFQLNTIRGYLDIIDVRAQIVLTSDLEYGDTLATLPAEARPEFDDRFVSISYPSDQSTREVEYFTVSSTTGEIKNVLNHTITSGSIIAIDFTAFK